MLRRMGMLAPALGFVTFLLLLPAREEHIEIDYVDRGESVHHCYTHLGWQDVLGPLSCSRWGAAVHHVGGHREVMPFPSPRGHYRSAS